MADGGHCRDGPNAVSTRSCKPFAIDSHHGLWMFCVEPIDNRQLANNDWRMMMPMPGVASTIESQCSFKELDGSHDGELQHRFYGWQQTALILLIASLTLAGLTLIVSFCSFCSKWFTLAWVSGMVLTCEFHTDHCQSSCFSRLLPHRSIDRISEWLSERTPTIVGTNGQRQNIHGKTALQLSDDSCLARLRLGLLVLHRRNDHLRDYNDHGVRCGRPVFCARPTCRCGCRYSQHNDEFIEHTDMEERQCTSVTV